MHRREAFRIDVDQAKLSTLRTHEQHVAAERRAEAATGAEECDVNRPGEFSRQSFLRIGGLRVSGVAAHFTPRAGFIGGGRAFTLIFSSATATAMMKSPK